MQTLGLALGDTTMAITCCTCFRIHHYSIERQTDGAVMIQDGKKFKGPVELVQHHERVLDGFLTRPTKACERHPEQQPMAWPGVTMLELEQCILEKAEQLCLRVSVTQCILEKVEQLYL